jgi:hypothetical protein
LDVAQRAGVSRTTASFVMTGRRDMRISEDPAPGVLHAARELNYRPNLLARSLRTNLSQTVGLISDVIATEACAGDAVRGSLATAPSGMHPLGCVGSDPPPAAGAPAAGQPCREPQQAAAGRLVLLGVPPGRTGLVTGSRRACCEQWGSGGAVRDWFKRSEVGGAVRDWSNA